MRQICTFTAVTLALSLCGCSQKQLYDAIQDNRQLECQKLTQPSQYEECMQNNRTSYETYKSARDDVKEQ